MKLRRLAVVVMLGLGLFGPSVWIDSPTKAQPLGVDGGRVELGLVLRQLGSTGTFMMATAHPDDENNALLALLAKGQGHRTVLVTATRGDGGQNEIGTELFDGLAVLRTEELLAAHRLDGAEQYFTRAVDFGYSFSIEETFDKWGRDEILGDFVRMIRTLRPDVITGMSPEGSGGGQHHQASAVLAHEAYHAAADPSRFPEQITEGLRPWQTKKFYFTAGFPFGFGGPRPGGGNRFRRPPESTDGGRTTVDLGVYDPLLGRTYSEIGSHARSMHKCQGMSQLIALPGPAAARYRLKETTIPNQAEVEESSLFDGIDTSIEGLIQYAGVRANRDLAIGLAAVTRHARDALSSFETDRMAGVRVSVLSGLAAVRNLRAAIGSLDLLEDARWEVDFRLAAKERQFERAVVLAHRLRLEAFADDGLVTPDQPITVSALVANSGDADVVVRQVSLTGFDRTSVACGEDVLAVADVYRCSAELRIPAETPLTSIHWNHVSGAARYSFDPAVPFGMPFRPTPFRATFEIEFASGRVSIERPIQHRYADDIFAGEKRMTLQVVPRFAVEITPQIAIIPEAARTAREIRVTVTNTGPEPVEGEIGLELPAGWRMTPGPATVQFSSEDESKTIRFAVSSGDAPIGEYPIRAVVRAAGTRFDRGYQVVTYPHIGRRHLVRPSEASFKIVDVTVAPDLSVGYITGVGDAVPPAIDQLGVRLEFIDADDLAWGDLSRFDVIVTGVRAYERRMDLRANNDRLLDYVAGGGTVIVQYNKFEFNDAQYGPYPAQVSRSRVTDEAAPIRVVANDHPVFTWPNLIDAQTWSDWVQERGLYFLGDRDQTYVDLVELEDSFEYNPGVKRGALVEARSGQGRWLYVGLGLWRQLPAGTTGAYELLANLLSLGRADETQSSGVTR